MIPKRSSRDKEKRRINKTYDTILFDSYKHALGFLNFESRKNVYGGKYVDLEDLGDLKIIQWFTNINIFPIL